MPNFVKIYTTPTCVYCKMAKEFFAKNAITYTEVNVAEDEEELQKMVQVSGQMGVPVIEANGEIFVGFDKRGLTKALGIQE
jgi:glutaredoxin 3